MLVTIDDKLVDKAEHQKILMRQWTFVRRDDDSNSSASTDTDAGSTSTAAQHKSKATYGKIITYRTNHMGEMEFLSVLFPFFPFMIL